MGTPSNDILSLLHSSFYVCHWWQITSGHRPIVVWQRAQTINSLVRVTFRFIYQTSKNRFLDQIKKYKIPTSCWLSELLPASAALFSMSSVHRSSFKAFKRSICWTPYSLWNAICCWRAICTIVLADSPLESVIVFQRPTSLLPV